MKAKFLAFLHKVFQALLILIRLWESKKDLTSEEMPTSDEDINN